MKAAMGKVFGIGIGLVTSFAGARASASDCASTNLTTLTSAPYTSYWGAYGWIVVGAIDLAAVTNANLVLAAS